MDMVRKKMNTYGEQFEKLSLDDYRRWKSLGLLDQIEPNYHVYNDVLNKMSDSYKEAGDDKISLICRLFSDISSLYFTNQAHAPFDAQWKFTNGRSFAIEDLSSKNLDFLETIVPETDNYLLKARFADILWNTRNQIDMARIAIDSYTHTEINSQIWYREQHDIWQRAVTLCKLLGRTDFCLQFIETIKKLFLHQFFSEDFSEKSAHLGYTDILLQLPLEDKEKQDIEDRLKEHLDRLVDLKNYYKARSYLTKLLLMNKKDDHEKRSWIYLRIAETFCFDAEREERNNNDMVAGSLYESAIKYYRMIPRDYRSQWNVDDRIEKTHAKMKSSNASSLLHMSTISTDGIDVSDAIKQSEQMISGKDLFSALKNICLVTPPFSCQRLKENTLEYIKHNPLASMCSPVFYGENGRIVARSQGVDIGNPESDSSESAFVSLMYWLYSFESSCVAQIAILPALRVFELEHRISEEELFQICYYANVVPPNRAHLWAKGLYFGFNDDFIAAMHILVPQIENMVRFGLQSKGINTTTINKDGTETEVGLSNLLKNPKISEIMSQDVLFEFHALLTEPLGVNMRNQIAHGLVADGNFSSSHPIYLWWICLKLVILSNPHFIKLIYQQPTEK